MSEQIQKPVHRRSSRQSQPEAADQPVMDARQAEAATRTAELLERCDELCLVIDDVLDSVVKTT